MANDDDIRSLVLLMRSMAEVQQNVNATLKTVGDKYDRVQTDIERLARQFGRTDENLIGKIGRVEAGVGSLGSDIKIVTNRLDAVVDRIDNRLDAVAERIDNRLNAVVDRVDAVVNRIDELERVVDRGLVESREMRIDLVGQSNEILNALQVALLAKSDLNDAVERIDQIEQKLGM